MDGKPLKAKHAKFVAEYLIDLNATQAAIRSGYAAKNADVTGPRLLGNVGIAAEIAKGQAKAIEKLGVNAVTVLNEYLLLATSDVGSILDFSGDEPCWKPANQISPEARRAIQSIKTKRYVEGSGENARIVEVSEFKMHSKQPALHDLACHLKLLTGLSTTQPVNVNINIGVKEDEEWYGSRNRAHAMAAEAIASSVASAAIAGPVQGDSVRETLGKKLNGVANGHAGPRPISGA